MTIELRDWVKMGAKRACNAWNNFMEELDQVVIESNETYCSELYKKMKALADEVVVNLRKAYNG